MAAHAASGQTLESERLLDLDPARRHAQMVDKLSLGHPGLGWPVLVLGIAVHGLGDEIRSPPQSQVLPRCPGVGDPRVDRCNASVVFAVLRRFPQELWRAAELPWPATASIPAK